MVESPLLASFKSSLDVFVNIHSSSKGIVLGHVAGLCYTGGQARLSPWSLLALESILGGASQLSQGRTYSHSRQVSEAASEPGPNDRLHKAVLILTGKLQEKHSYSNFPP